jgi:hypothetical protein
MKQKKIQISIMNRIITVLKQKLQNKSRLNYQIKEKNHSKKLLYKSKENNTRGHRQ